MVAREFFSPSNSVFLALISFVGFLILVLAFLIVKRLSNKKKSLPKVQQNPIEQQKFQQPVNPIQNNQQSQEEIKLTQYVQKSLASGFQKYDIQRNLTQVGWNPQLIQKILSKFP